MNSYALMLWGDPVDSFNDLDTDLTKAPLLLYAGAGFDEVQQPGHRRPAGSG